MRRFREVREEKSNPERRIVRDANLAFILPDDSGNGPIVDHTLAEQYFEAQMPIANPTPEEIYEWKNFGRILSPMERLERSFEEDCLFVE